MTETVPNHEVTAPYLGRITREPGDWTGWKRLGHSGHAYQLCGPNGEQLRYIADGWGRRYRGTASSSPWAANNAGDTLLRDKAGNIRTFGSALAALRALRADEAMKDQAARSQKGRL